MFVTCLIGEFKIEKLWAKSMVNAVIHPLYELGLFMRIYN